jgi:hypothetical protein
VASRSGPSWLQTIRSLAWLPDASDATVVRTVGGMQLASGLFDVFVMTTVQCFGLGWLGGLPACLGLLLLAVGAVEIASGLRTLATGDAGWVRRTAVLEVVALAGGGVVAAAVGAIVMIASRRYPTALPDPAGPSRST